MKRRLSNALSLDDLVRLVKQVQEIIRSSSESGLEVDIDLSGILPLDTSFFVTTANLIDFLRGNESKEVVLSLSPNHKFSLDEFLPSLQSHAKEVPSVTTQLHQFELTKFTSSDPAIVQDFVGRFQDYLPNISAKIERFENTLAELMENVSVHSNCAWGGYIYAYLDKTNRALQFSIADFGIGIPWTLARVSPYNSELDDDILTYEASKYSVTSKTGRAGSGLDYAANFARSLNGVMRVYSRKGCLRIDSEANCLLEPEAEFPGTLITIELPLR